MDSELFFFGVFNFFVDEGFGKKTDQVELGWQMSVAPSKLNWVMMKLNSIPFGTTSPLAERR